MATIRFEGLEKRFGDFTAVDGIDLTIDHGEFFTFVGPSGCGKTTTLRMLAGLEQPSAGEIYFDDEPITDLTPQQRDIAMVFQNIALYPHMSIKDNIGYGLKVRNETEGYDRKIENVARLLEIDDQLDKKPGGLSGGQQQRVALGRAIVRNPNAILLDEPMSDLDAKLKAELRVKIKEVYQELDTTMVYVTHDQEEAMTMSTRVGLMNEGNLIQVDEPEVLFQAPKNEFVAQFIGQPPMNIVDAKIDNDEELVLSNAERRYVLDADLSDSVRAASKLGLGFRPADGELTDDLSDSIFEVTFNVFEPTGLEYIVDLVDRENKELKVVTDALPTAEPGDTIGIRSISNMYFFDQATGDLLQHLTPAEFDLYSREDESVMGV